MISPFKEWHKTRCQWKLLKRLKTKYMEVNLIAQEPSSNQLVTQRYNLRSQFLRYNPHSKV